MQSSLAMKPFEGENAFPHPSEAMVDFCTREGAEALKRMIEEYWRARGHAVLVSLENVGFHPAIRAARYEVRSDMVNGMPRSAPATPKAGPAPAPANDSVFVEDFDDDDLDIV